VALVCVVRTNFWSQRKSLLLKTLCQESGNDPRSRTCKKTPYNGRPDQLKALKRMR
jgi:hypothetical protein